MDSIQDLKERRNIMLRDRILFFRRVFLTGRLGITRRKDLAESKIRYTFAPGEMAEWSIAAVLKTVELRGSGGSNPSLSAIKGVNQAFARFTPFFTPKNVKLGVFVFFKILQKNVNYKAIGISMDWQNEPL